MRRQVIPEGLAEMPPGPKLGAALADIDPTRLSGPDCVSVLRAQYRQLAHDQARFLAAMAETALCGIGPDDQIIRDESPSEFAAAEIRAALTWTRRMADTQFGLAVDLVHRLPKAHTALGTGSIDLPKAKIFAEWTRDLTTQQARAVCQALLPKAPALTTGELIDEIKKMTIAIDPEWAARRYREAVATRRVVGYRNPDGTANLSGLQLPLDEAAAACAHIDALARKVKRAGDTRRIDLIRADLFLRLLDGTYAGWDEPAIIAHLLAHPDDRPPAPSPAHTQATTKTAANNASPANPADLAGTADPAHSADPAEPAQPADSVSSAGVAGSPGSADLGAPPVGARPLQRYGVELRVRLSTLLGLDEHPAEIAGWGPAHADRAREITRRQTRTEWRYAVCDADGRLLHAGLVSRRPADHPKPSAVRGGIVELQIPLGLLNELTADPGRYRHWAPVLGEIARRITEGPSGAGTPAGGGSAGGLDRRAPTAPVRRHVQIRDRRCQFMGCRMPAAGTDADHRAQWQRGGRTQEENLESLCRYDHRLKDEGGWTVTSSVPGFLEWVSPLGQAYVVRPPAIITPLPDPCPRPEGLHAAPSLHVEGDGGPIWWPPPAPARAEPHPRPPPADTPPPF